MAGAGASFIAGELASLGFPVLDPFAQILGWGIAAALGFYALEPWFKSQALRRIGGKTWLAPDVRDGWHWYLYKPEISSPYRIATNNSGKQHSVFIHLYIDAIYPYGETFIYFSKANLMVRQDKKNYLFEFAGEFSTDILSPGEQRQHQASFCWLDDKHPGQKPPNVDWAFSWKLAGVRAKFGSHQIKRILPIISGVREGREHNGAR